ncbi:succinate dehydrogenase assembly factor 1 mitochondrial [Clonorchis sinensis]|nr:succinate dehydrogenase assembly factor 1 mitochondrial [Clonorchis sinensis]
MGQWSRRELTGWKVRDSNSTFAYRLLLSALVLLPGGMAGMRRKDVTLERLSELVIDLCLLRPPYLADVGSMSRVHSKLQREVLRLYRDLLRSVTPRPVCGDAEPESRPELTSLRQSIRNEFRRQASLYKRTDILQIEAALRRGHRRLEDLNSGTVDRLARIQPTQELPKKTS